MALVSKGKTKDALTEFSNTLAINPNYIAAKKAFENLKNSVDQPGRAAP
jgi:hypothetical protein